MAEERAGFYALVLAEMRAHVMIVLGALTLLFDLAALVTLSHFLALPFSHLLWGNLVAVPLMTWAALAGKRVYAGLERRFGDVVNTHLKAKTSESKRQGQRLDLAGAKGAAQNIVRFLSDPVSTPEAAADDANEWFARTGAWISEEFGEDW